MRQVESGEDDQPAAIPRTGDRVVGAKGGKVCFGTVQYADELQVLIKWDDGTSSSLRVGQDRYRIIEAE
jgi:hypothetical protein